MTPHIFTLTFTVSFPHVNLERWAQLLKCRRPFRVKISPRFWELSRDPHFTSLRFEFHENWPHAQFTKQESGNLEVRPETILAFEG